jgi:hypothetical protein
VRQPGTLPPTRPPNVGVEVGIERRVGVEVRLVAIKQRANRDETGMVGEARPVAAVAVICCNRTSFLVWICHGLNRAVKNNGENNDTKAPQ